MPNNIRSVLEAADKLLQRGSIGVLVTIIDQSPHVGAKVLFDENNNRVGSLGDPELDRVAQVHANQFLKARDNTRALRVAEFAPELELAEEVLVLFERIQPEPRLVICGAGHVGASLATLSNLAGFRVTLIDDRKEFLQRDRFPDENIKLVLTTNWTNTVAEAIGNGRGVSVAVVTRGHNEDEKCLQAVIATGASYIGMIGSKRRTSIVLDRLRESGVAAEIVSSIYAPIGLDIGAVTPEEVAVAILAELIANRRGGKGGSLSTSRR